MRLSAVVGGTVVTPGGPDRADVLISDGMIVTVAAPSAAARWETADHVLDASGCYVLPGGVDPHCHLMAEPPLATAAAARGGTTTALSFTSPRAGEATLDCLLRSRRELDTRRPVVDVGLHAAVYDPDRVGAGELTAIRRAGAASIKIFLAYDELGIMCSTRRMYELMSAAREVGLVVQVHCENGALIDAIEAEVLAARAPEPEKRRDLADPGPRIFAETRPAEAEEEAVARVLATAKAAGAACYLVHLSSAGAVAQVRLARGSERPAALAEACVHHLLLDDSCYARPDARRFLVCPPLRSSGHIEALWEALADGTIDAVGSDHCQAKTATSGQLAAAGHNLEYGLAGIGPRLPLLLSSAIARGLPISRVAQIACEQPARAFGHYPRKGALLPGSDADIVVFDPDGTTTLPGDGFGDGTGDSVYAGMVTRGRVRDVVLRGQMIVTDGALIDQPPTGRYLPAGTQARDGQPASATRPAL